MQLPRWHVVYLLQASLSLVLVSSTRTSFNSMHTYKPWLAYSCYVYMFMLCTGCLIVCSGSRLTGCQWFAVPVYFAMPACVPARHLLGKVPGHVFLLVPWSLRPLPRGFVFVFNPF